MYRFFCIRMYLRFKISRTGYNPSEADGSSGPTRPVQNLGERTIRGKALNDFQRFRDHFTIFNFERLDGLLTIRQGYNHITHIGIIG